LNNAKHNSIIIYSRIRKTV